MQDINSEQARLFVLDTNVLMHDPTAIFRFKEHNIFLPMVVLEELDASKKGLSEVARNVRQVTRFLDQLMTTATKSDIDNGLDLCRSTYENDESPNHLCGRLYFQTKNLPHLLSETNLQNTPDNTILEISIALQQQLTHYSITLVSKDINLRIKAAVLGIHAEDYSSDRVLEDVNLLYSGTSALLPGIWESYSNNAKTWKEDGRTFYRVSGAEVERWYPCQCLYAADRDNLELLVRRKERIDIAVLELLQDYRIPRRNVWGITARNREQNFAFNLLLDPEIDFVSLVGSAGTGKTLLALAAGLNQVLERNRYREIIMTRATVAVGDDIGFLPGTEEEKMTPWMGSLMDNLDVLTHHSEGGEWARAATTDLVRNRIRINSMAFMRGRTFLNKYLIIDEAQNLTPKQIKALITRAGPGTKVICLGNVSQIDTPYLTETTTGLTYVVDRFRHWDHGGHVTLLRGERSRLADFASDTL